MEVTSSDYLEHEERVLSGTLGGMDGFRHCCSQELKPCHHEPPSLASALLGFGVIFRHIPLRVAERTISSSRLLSHLGSRAKKKKISLSQ